MTEIFPPPEHVRVAPVAPAHGAPTPTPRRTRRWRLIGVPAGVVVLAAILLAVLGVGRLSGTRASGLTPPALPTSTSFPVAAPPAAAAPPLSAAAVAAKVDPGLVDINVVDGAQGAQGAATGMVLTSSGVVLTNNHVVRGATHISIRDIGNGKTYAASVLGYDRARDVALVQLRSAAGLHTVALGDSSTVAHGATVTALGNAGGIGGPPQVARGVVTALSQTITASDAGGGNAQRLHGLIETNAAIRPGDSGGPLVNAAGQVVGMNAAASTGFSRRASVQGYAIPIAAALSIARQIAQGTASTTVHIGATGFLGVEVVPPAQPSAGGLGVSHAGATVAGVLSGYPAAGVGLTAGDVITAVDGRIVTSAAALTDLLSAHHPGDTVRLHWLDPAGHGHDVTVTLASGPAA
jgi:S1-C subfamily serine protease